MGGLACAVTLWGSSMSELEESASANRPARNHHDYSPTGLLDAAERMFLERGYAAVRIDQLAVEARTAKRTIYRQYGDKAGLFEAVIRRLNDAVVDDMIDRFHPEQPVRDELIAFSTRLLDASLSEAALALYRLVAAEAGRFPDLARCYYEAAPGRSIAALSAYLGSLDGQWPDLSRSASSHAEAIVNLTLGESHRRATFQVGKIPRGAERMRIAERAVDTVLATLRPKENA